MKNTFLIGLALILSACGGGGGGSSPPPGTGLTVQFSTSTLSSEYLQGSAPAPMTLSASASGATDKDLLIGAEVTGTGIALPISVAIDPVTRQGTITVMPAGGLAAGTYAGSIKLLACTTQACTVQHAGSPHTVSYTITVRPSLNPSITFVPIATVETGTATRDITFNSPGTNITVSSAVTYDSQKTGWLASTLNGNAVRVQVSAATLPVGVYRAYVGLDTSDGKQSYRIPVELTVATGLSVPASATLTINNGSTAAQLQGTIGLVIAPGAAATEWTATSDQPWFQLDAERGAVGTQPVWRIDPTAFNRLPNNVTYKANVRIATNSPLAPRTTVFEVSKALAELKGLDSIALLAGQSGDVLLYGTGFDALGSTGTPVSVAGVQPSAITRVNDKVMRLTMPAMAAGSYLVSLNANPLLSTQGKAIHVTSGFTAAYQSIPTEGRKVSLIWDSVSRSVFVVNKTLKSVMRYALVGGSFQLVTTRSFPYVDAIAMSPDHAALVLQSGNSKVYKLSPTDLSTLAIFDLSAFGGSESDLRHRLSVMGDNRLMNNFGWVDLDSGVVTPLKYAGFTDGYRSAPWGAVSGNGQRMMRPDSGRTSPSGPIMHLEVGNGIFTPYGEMRTPYFYDYAVNHEGSKFAFNNQVVDYDMNVLGNYALPADWHSSVSVFNRSGSRLYSYAFRSDGGRGRVYVYDTSEALTVTVNFKMIGSFEVTDSPSCPFIYSGSGNYDNCYFSLTNMAMSDDGKTLFFAGDRAFVVMPVPANMQSAAPVRQGSAMIPANALKPKRVN